MVKQLKIFFNIFFYTLRAKVQLFYLIARKNIKKMLFFLKNLRFEALFMQKHNKMSTKQALKLNVFSAIFNA